MTLVQYKICRKSNDSYWTTNFKEAYEIAKLNPSKLKQEDRDRLQFAVATTNVFLSALSHSYKSPLVVYTNCWEEED